jgi:hypothetical protein
MKAITAIAAAAVLLFGVTAASAQSSRSGDNKPAATKSQQMKSPSTRSTTGAGSTGQTPGSNPNPTWNKNPDPEVPGNTEQ